MKPIYRLYRRSLTILWTAATLLLVLFAVIAGLAELLLPYVDRYQNHIETKLSEYAGQPVRFESVEGQWDVTGPEFKVSGLTILDNDTSTGTPELVIEQARIKFSLLNYLIPGRAFYKFEIVGAELQLRRDSSGVLKFSGLSSDEPMNLSEMLTLFTSTEQLDFTDASLIIKDDISGFSATFKASLAQVVYQDGTILAGWHAQLAAENSNFSLDVFIGEEVDALDGQLSLRLEDSVPQELKVYVSSIFSQPGQFMSKLTEDWGQTIEGSIAAETWLEWQAGEPIGLQGKLKATELLWQLHPQDAPVKLDTLGFDWKLRLRDSQQWSVALANISAMSSDQQRLGGELIFQYNPDSETRIHLQTEAIDLEFAQSILQPLVRKLDFETPWLDKIMTGKIERLDLGLDIKNQISFLDLQANRVSMQSVSDELTLGPLDVSIYFNQTDGVMKLSGGNTQLSWPRIFSQQQSWDNFQCQLDFARNTASQLQLQTQFCELNNNDISMGLEFGMLIAGGSPTVDAQVFIKHLSAPDLKKYWPDGVMSQQSVAWLSRAFTAGEVRAGHIQVLGKLDEFPFRNNNGIFSAKLPAYGMGLDFDADWPNLKDTEAVVLFADRHMNIKAKTASTNGLEIKSASAVLDFTSKLVVDIRFDERLATEKIKEYIHASPLEETLDISIEPIQITGPARTTGRLIFYMDKRPQWFRVSGQLDLDNASLYLSDWSVQLENLDGVLDWSEQGLNISNMTARLGDAKAVLSMQAGPEKAAGNVLYGLLKLESTLANLIPPSFAARDEINSYLSGVANWELGITIEKRRADGTIPLYLNLDSDLQGLEIKLPAPLAKSAESSWPLQVHIPLQGPSRQLIVKFKDRLGFRASLDESRSQMESVRILMGDDTVGEPRKGYLDIGGLTPEFDLDGWLGILTGDIATTGSSVIEPGNLAFEASELGFLGRKIPDTRLEINYLNDGYEALFSGPSMAGRIWLPGGSRKALIADFDRLLLPASEEEIPKLEINPAEIPPMHLYAREFTFGHLSLKETRIETYPLTNGLHFETLEGDYNSVHLTATGDWTQNDQGQQHSEFKLHISAETIDELMQVLDFDAGVTGGQTVVDFQGGWDGSPIAFESSSLNGKLELSAKNGRLVDAEPGAGRLLGLISLQALPRRLMFDFRDVFTQGFSFDSATGKFEIEDGIIHITNMKVKSPAAEMLIYGATDMNKREYDQLIRVRPGVGATLPVLGAIAAGPGGAAAGLALQALFRKSLGKAAEAVYTVTGSWDDPVITQLNKEEMRASNFADENAPAQQRTKGKNKP